MLGATHLLVGAAVYKKTPNRLAAYTLAFMSHFVLDAIPHYELRSDLNYVLAIAAGLFLSAIAWRRKDMGLLIAAFLGAVVDLNWILNISEFLVWANDYVHKIFPQVTLLFVLEPLIIMASSAYLLRNSGQRFANNGYKFAQGDRHPLSFITLGTFRPNSLEPKK